MATLRLGLRAVCAPYTRALLERIGCSGRANEVVGKAPEETGRSRAGSAIAAGYHAMMADQFAEPAGSTWEYRRGGGCSVF